MRGDGPPLQGVKVIDLGQIYNAPYATLLLALAGADVVKVEPPGGENLRGRGRAAGAGAPFVMLNSNKRGVVVDLKHPRGAELLASMAERADVLVENFRPGVMDRLGLGPALLRARNPRLVYASGSGYGSTGPYRDLPAMDLTIQAMAGVMAVTGFPEHGPVKAGPALGDFLGGVHLYAAIVTALYDRERTGRGARVEVAMFDAVYPTLMSSLGLYFGRSGATGADEGAERPTRTGNRHSGLAESPYNVYAAADGHVALICVTDAHWRALAKAMGRPELGDDARFATRLGRVARLEEVDEIVADWTRTRRRDEVVDELTRAGVPCAPVRELEEVVEDPHLRARGMLREVEVPGMGVLPLPHSPLRFEGVDVPLRPAPGLGEHTAEVLTEWVGMDANGIERLREEGVISCGERS